MIADLVNEYYKYKKKTFYEYTKLLSKIMNIEQKKILHNRKRTEEVLEKVVDIYIDKLFQNYEKKFDISKILLSNNYIDKFNLHMEFMAVTEYFMKNNIILDLEINEKDIILICVLLKISNKIDALTSPFIKEKININSILTECVEKYHKIDFIFLVDQGKKNTKLFCDLVKNNIKKEKQFFECLDRSISFNRYIQIDDNANYFISQYNYSITELEKYDSKIVKKLYYSKNIDDNFTLISADIINTLLIKELSIRKKISTFFLPIKKKFLDKEKNIKDLKKLLETKLTNKYLKILINYNECNEELINILNKNQLDYYLYCNKNVSLATFNKNQKYLLSKEFIKKNEELIKNLPKNVIAESINKFIEDKDIISTMS